MYYTVDSGSILKYLWVWDDQPWRVIICVIVCTNFTVVDAILSLLRVRTKVRGRVQSVLP